MRKTKLIVRSNPDDLLKAKNEIIAEAQASNNLVRYSDYAVETNDYLYTFKVVVLPRQVLDQIRGYDEVNADELLTSLDKFVEDVKTVCKVEDLPKDEPTSASPEAQNEPQMNDGGQDDTDAQKED